MSFLLGNNLIETFDVNFLKTSYPSSSLGYFNYRFLAVFSKLTQGRGDEVGRGRTLYQSQWKYKVLIMLTEEIWAFGYVCGSEIF